MLQIVKIIFIVILFTPIIVQAGYNGYIASHCSDYHNQGMTYNKKITSICMPEWQKLTEKAKLSFPNNF